jgi:hypothetical protein
MAYRSEYFGKQLARKLVNERLEVERAIGGRVVAFWGVVVVRALSESRQASESSKYDGSGGTRRDIRHNGVSRVAQLEEQLVERAQHAVSSSSWVCAPSVHCRREGCCTNNFSGVDPGMMDILSYHEGRTLIYLTLSFNLAKDGTSYCKSSKLRK